MLPVSGVISVLFRRVAWACMCACVLCAMMSVYSVCAHDAATRGCVCVHNLECERVYD